MLVLVIMLANDLLLPAPVPLLPFSGATLPLQLRSALACLCNTSHFRLHIALWIPAFLVMVVLLVVVGEILSHLSVWSSTEFCLFLFSGSFRTYVLAVPASGIPADAMAFSGGLAVVSSSTNGYVTM